MPPEKKDEAYLWDIVDAAEAIISFVSGFSFEQYSRDRKTQLAVERGLEIIGEAAKRISEGFRNLHPLIPWVKIIALRNVLAHEYGEIRQERIWAVIQEHIPGLVKEIKPILKNVD